MFADSGKDKDVSETNNIIDLLQAGLRAEGLREKTISSNIANMETPGYRRIDIRFNEMLAKALDSSSTVDLNDVKPEIFQPQNTLVKANGNDVNLESEIGDMVKNSLRHETYIKLLHQKFSQMQEAIDVRA
jgi:flagellar basal-body rod protein FlgB